MARVASERTEIAEALHKATEAKRLEPVRLRIAPLASVKGRRFNAIPGYTWVLVCDDAAEAGAIVELLEKVVTTIPKVGVDELRTMVDGLSVEEERRHG